MTVDTAAEAATERILTPEALDFVTEIHGRFDARRRDLLAARAERRERLAAGELPDFLPETAEIRESEWAISPVPADLRDRRVEITGPDRPEDGDQRAQLGRAHVHGGLRGRELADLVEPHRGAGKPDRRYRAADRARDPGEGIPAERRRRDAPRPAARAAPPGEARRRRRWARSPARSSTSAFTSSTTGGGCSTAAPGRTSTFPSSRATSKRGSGTTSSRSPRRRSAYRMGRSGPPS